jgi:preprotein translocase subunit YajC
VKNLSSVLPLVLLIGAFWLLVIRPNKKRQTDAAKLRNSISVGQRVVTTSGAFIEMAPGVTMTWLKGAVSRVIEPVATDGEGA